MKVNVKELYENDEWVWCDYQPMLGAFGKIVIQVDDNGYQGDSRLLYDENSKIGVLIFGWGSCCGCDSLQACCSLEEVQELCDELQESIKWFDDKKQALEYFTNHDWQGDYSWYQDETKEFINKCIEYLSADHPTEKVGAKMDGRGEDHETL